MFIQRHFDNIQETQLDLAQTHAQFPTLLEHRLYVASTLEGLF